MIRPPLALLALGAAATVVAAAWWLGDNPLPGPAAAAPTGITVSPGAGAEPPATSPTDEQLPSLEGADDGLTDEDLWAYIADPAQSDLPPDVFTELSALGTDVVRADATGDGRDRWPYYWQGLPASMGKAEPCCTDITIHAAGATTDPSGPERTVVTVAWSPPQDRTNTDDAVHITTIKLEHRGDTWQPTR